MKTRVIIVENLWTSIMNCPFKNLALSFMKFLFFKNTFVNLINPANTILQKEKYSTLFSTYNFYLQLLLQDRTLIGTTHFLRWMKLKGKTAFDIFMMNCLVNFKWTVYSCKTLSSVKNPCNLFNAFIWDYENLKKTANWLQQPH